MKKGILVTHLFRLLNYTSFEKYFNNYFTKYLNNKIQFELFGLHGIHLECLMKLV